MSAPSTTAPVAPSGREGRAVLRSYGPADVDRLREPLAALGEDAPAALEEARHRPGFRLLTASVDARLAGCVAVSAADGLARIEALVTAPGLTADAAAGLVDELVAAALDAVDLPWADLAVRASSPALPRLLRDGWQPVPARGADGLLTLSAALAVA